MASLLRQSLFVILATFGLGLATADTARAQVCTGRFVNPITDICWECSFPITLGSVPISVESSALDTSNPNSPICVCPDPVPRVGVPVGFWEPARLIDVTRVPGCFVNLGGLPIELGSIRRGGTDGGDGGKGNTLMHTHYYHYPVWSLLEVLTSVACVDPGSVFDIAYVSELDPLWNDGELAALLTPEMVLFANPVAQAACTVDCATSTAGLPLTELFWCAGCQGGMYPMTGRVKSHIGGVQASLLVAQRLMFRLHRQLTAWGTIGNGALCSRFPMPIMNKRQYRFQMVNPVPQVVPALACNPTGRTSVHYEGLAGEMKQTVETCRQSNSPVLVDVAERLSNAIAILEDTTEWLMAQKGSMDVLAGATPYLRLFGLVAGCHYLARGAHAVTQDDVEPNFARRKTASTQFYAHNLLSAVGGLADAVKAGNDMLEDIGLDALAS